MKRLADNEGQTLKEMSECHGSAGLGGYYQVDRAKVDKAMQLSEVFNSIVDWRTKCA